MADKKIDNDIVELLEQVFSRPPGSSLAKPLREGAAIQGTVDDESYFLEKHNGALRVSAGRTTRPDISVTTNRATLEYMASAEELQDFITRGRECIDGSHGDCRMTYVINASLPKLLLKGYLEFARTFGLV
jgi:hypothetical protein